jgi:hypothetical protein
MPTNSKLIEAVRTLVDAVITEHCTILEGDDALFHEEFAVKSALAVLREIRASQEHSSLHKWADKRLRDHGDSYSLSYEDVLPGLRKSLEGGGDE